MLIKKLLSDCEMLARDGKLQIDNLLQILKSLSKSSAYKGLIELENWRYIL